MKPSLCAIDVNGANQSQVERDPDGGMSRLFSIASPRGMALQPDCQAQTRLSSEVSTKSSLSPPKSSSFSINFSRDTA
jgi:hypothetical protein